MSLFHLQLTAFCEQCGKWEYMDSKTVKKAMREARLRQWTITSQRTLICPRCNGKNPEWEAPMTIYYG